MSAGGTAINIRTMTLFSFVNVMPLLIVVARRWRNHRALPTFVMLMAKILPTA